MDYDTGNMEWYNFVLPMRPRCGLTSDDFEDMEDQYHIQLEDEILGENLLQSYAIEKLDAKYEFTNVRTVVDNPQHLDQSLKIMIY